jgi:glucan phosphoethanolaminetransferase (alkaline phosphatase superfamily)
MGPRGAGAAARRTAGLLLGQPRSDLATLLGPTAISLALDLAERARPLAAYALQGKAIYASSLVVSAGFWGLPLWACARLGAPGAGPAARAARWALVVLWLVPWSAFAFGGQVIYRRVFASYMGRDTLRLGIALRGTVTGWFDAWGGPWLAAAMVLAGGAVTWASLRAARPIGQRHAGPLPLLLPATFAGAFVCFWTDNVDSRFLQAALPDACFVHGAVHALRMAVSGQWGRRQGVSLRTPLPLPPLANERARPIDVLVVLTESVRADASCSDPPPACVSPFLDAVARDRVSLGLLTSQTPNTFSASMVLWTGLVPTATFTEAHSAPVLWELARAVGYRTAYVSSQNPEYEDFGAFTRHAGIDVNVTAVDLGGMAQEQLGAPDERAADALLRFVRATPETTPYLAVLHLSNTHAPYRVDPSLLPFEPESADPLGKVETFHNRYRDAVRLQERTVAGVLRSIEALPRWDHTVVVFLSDHGEEFREHGGLYHNHSLYEEELRIPGWLLAGPHALDLAERNALSTYAGFRAYTQDVHETVVDLIGLEDARATLPLASRVTGRSLLRPRSGEPTVLLATSTSVWEPDDARFGVMKGSRLVSSGSRDGWLCFDVASDPQERSPRPATQCGDLLSVARTEFAGIARP